MWWARNKSRSCGWRHQRHSVRGSHARRDTIRLDLFLFFVTLAVLNAVGCNRAGANLAKVRGTVTLDGQSVAEGTIQFWPTSGRPARSNIKDGAYELTTYEDGDGALLGDHLVTIKSTKLTEPEPDVSSIQEEIDYYRNADQARIRASVVVWVVPEHYSDRTLSPLTAHVEPGQNVFDFPLSHQSKEQSR